MARQRPKWRRRWKTPMEDMGVEAPQVVALALVVLVADPGAAPVLVAVWAMMLAVLFNRIHLPTAGLIKAPYGPNRVHS